MQVYPSIPSILEPVGVDRRDCKRPNGIAVFPFSNRRSICRDATCTDTYADTNIYSSAVSVGHAAREAVQRKHRKALRARFKFQPVAVETAGLYGEFTAALISEISRRITEATGESRETLWLEQRFGLAVQRGNALSILTAVRKKYEVELGTS